MPDSEREDYASPLVDPLGVSEEELGRIVEASDLSKNPGLALESVLEARHLSARRRVADPSAQSGRTRRARCGPPPRPGMRLFALSLDRHGSAVLHEMRHGTAVAIRQLHVDFAQEPSEPAETMAKPEPVPGSWTGAVEPIGFPFRFGVEGKIEAFDFDQNERWLLTASRQGMLHLWEVGGSLVEILPRAFYQNTILTEPHAIVGVHGGFVVVARSPVLPGSSLSRSQAAVQGLSAGSRGRTRSAPLFHLGVCAGSMIASSPSGPIRAA